MKCYVWPQNSSKCEAKHSCFINTFIKIPLKECANTFYLFIFKIEVMLIYKTVCYMCITLYFYFCKPYNVFAGFTKVDIFLPFVEKLLLNFFYPMLTTKNLIT